MCALYFNFTGVDESNMFFGAVEDGALHQRADLGFRDDPQGKWALSKDGSGFAFLTVEGNRKGCCDPTAVMTVDFATGKAAATSIPRTVEGVKCGIWGCGFMEVGGFDAQARSVVGWVEKQMPPPPPAAPGASEGPPRRRGARPDRRSRRGALPSSRTTANDHIGEALVQFDAAAGDATEIRPFFLDADDAKGPAVMASGLSAFDDQGRMWFACNPTGDFDKEGLCSVAVAKSKDNAVVTSVKSPYKKLTISSIEYSAATSSVIVVAQSFASGGDRMETTQVFQVGANATNGGWPQLVDLGTSWDALHSTAMSPDGRYLTVLLPVGPDEDTAENHLVTVDVVTKKEVGRVVIKDQNLAPLAAIPC